MEMVLWIVQIILAVKLAATAVSHAVPQRRPPMREALARLGPRAGWIHNACAAAMAVTALGMVLPAALRWEPRLTTVFAAAAASLFLLSIFFHLQTRERPMVFADLILFALAAALAYGRWMFPA